jgi:O-antigen/teichoic acid export membrane protein
MTGSSNHSADDKISFVDQKTVGNRVRTGALWSVGQIFVRNGLSLVLTAILARILLPEDYGLIGMVATLTALLQVFANMGLSWATVRSTDLNMHQVSGLFWVNLVVGVLVWGVMAAAAPFVAQFYGAPALNLIAVVSGVSFVMAGASVQPIALLTRAMDFRRISIIEMIALCCSATVALCLAFAGAGYWALVAQGPVQALVRLVLSIGPSRMRVLAPCWAPGLSAMIRFGGLLVLNGFLIFIARNLDSVMIGKVWGAAELGYYNRAYFLMLLPSMLASSVLSQVMVSALSSMQHDRAQLASAYRRALGMVAYFGTPMALGLALTASSVVPLVYGPGWDKVVLLLAWLSIAGITQPIYNTNGWLFTACGRAKTYFWVTLANTMILGTVFALTVSQGTIALAQAYGITMGLVLPLPALWIAHRAAAIPFRPSLQVLMPVAALNATMGGVVWLIGAIAEPLGFSQFAVLPVQVAAGAIVYVGLTPLLLPDMMRRDLAPLLQKLIRRKDTETS